MLTFCFDSICCVKFSHEIQYIFCSVVVLSWPYVKKKGYREVNSTYLELMLMNGCDQIW